MPEKEPPKEFDQVLKRLLNTPPVPHEQIKGNGKKKAEEARKK